MKTTIKLALLASALLLALAGCKNTFTPTNPSPDSFAKNVEGGNTTNPLYVIDAVANGKYDTGEYRVTVKFSQPVDLETVTKAVIFYNLKDGLSSTAKSEKNGVVTDVSKEDVLDKDNTKEVHFKLPKEAKDKLLWVEVVGKELKAARNAQKMDQDKDGVQGEEDDDFYATTVDIGSPAFSYGIVTNLNHGAANKIISSLFEASRFSFLKGRKEDLTDDTSRPNIVTHICFSNNNSSYSEFESVEKYGIDNETFKNLLQKHIVVEQYVNNKWESVQTTFKESSNATYSRCLVGGISVGQDVSLRVRLVDIQDMKNIKSKKFEYKLKYTHDARHTNSKVLLNEYSGLTKGYESLAASTLKLLPTSQLGSQTLRFELPSSVKLYGKEGEKTVTPKRDSDHYYVGYKGFDTNTLKREYFVTEIVAKPICIQYKKSFTSSSGITKYFTLDFALIDAFLKEGSAVGMTTQSIVEYVGDFTNTDTDHYFADAVTQFCFTYNNVFNTEKISRKINGIFSSLIELYDSIHKSGALPSNTYKYNSLTEALFRYLTNREHVSENDALTFIDEGVKEIRDLGSEGFEKSVVYTSLPFVLYISPEVQIAAFKGVVSGSSEDVTVGPLNFKQSDASSHNPLLSAGWQMVTFN